jgi:hypothetical protein
MCRCGQFTATLSGSCYYYFRTIRTDGLGRSVREQRMKQTFKAAGLHMMAWLGPYLVARLCSWAFSGEQMTF